MAVAALETCRKPQIPTPPMSAATARDTRIRLVTERFFIGIQYRRRSYRRSSWVMSKTPAARPPALQQASLLLLLLRIDQRDHGTGRDAGHRYFVVIAGENLNLLSRVMSVIRQIDNRFAVARENGLGR